MPEILVKENIIVNLPSESYEEAIRRCGTMLYASGYVKEPYIEGMVTRESEVSTAIGNKLAIPHGTNAVKDQVIHTGLVVLTYPDGIDWHGTEVKLVIGIAASGDEHLGILANVAEAFSQESLVDDMVNLRSVDAIYNTLAK